jgi:putative copper export protein
MLHLSDINSKFCMVATFVMSKVSCVGMFMNSMRIQDFLSVASTVHEPSSFK